MAIDISTFKAGFNGGTRANRFNVAIPNWPATIQDIPTTLAYHAVAAKLPENELGSIPVPWMGRVAHFAGDRDYKPWTVTFIDDIGTNNKHLWHAFHSWMNLLNSHKNNTTKDKTFARNNLLQDVVFNQLHDPSGGSSTTGHTVIRTITLKHAWPSEVSQISFDMGEGGSLVNFSVTFTFDYYTITTPATT